MNEERAKLNKYVGKTVQSFLYEEVGTDEFINIEFTDGSKLQIKSQDYEGYSSSLTITCYGNNRDITK